MFALWENQLIFPFDSTKHYSTYDKIVLCRLDSVFPALIKLDKHFLGGRQSLLRFGLAMTEEIMNNVFLSRGFGYVTDKGPCIFVSANDLYLLQTESECFKKKGVYLFD